MSIFKTIQDVWKYLDTIPRFQDRGVSAANFELENITKFCELIGNPQNTFPSVHVAGTNGKGTTCYLLEAVYQKAGYKTGMFTSPHLTCYNERFRINGKDVEVALILKFFQKYQKEIEETHLTYFEISTALSFWLFAQAQVDIAIIETGLGGRLDSTNIILPKASIITSIGLDHQDILGNTEVEIAREKAGIIKENTPVILGNILEENEAVISEIADHKSADLYHVRDFYPTWDAGEFGIKNKILSIKTQLLEEVNKWNIAAVYKSVKVIADEFPVSKADFIDAVESFTGAPARFEKLHSKKDWYFSGAHNVQALSSTLATASTLSDKPGIIIFSLMRDKLNMEVVELINTYDQKYYYELNTERAATIKEVRKLIDVEKVDENTYKSIFKEFETSLVIFTGSFYFYSTVKRWVSNC